MISGLVQDGKYRCKVLTRDVESTSAKQLVNLGNVELLEGSFTDENKMKEGYKESQGDFINIDGFNTGEKTEMFWAIRAYELAIEVKNIQFFVYGNLDYVYKKSGCDSRFRCGHYDGKGRIGE